MALGFIIGMSAWVWFLMLAFDENPGWGVACLALGVLGMVAFMVMHIEETWRAFVCHLAGLILFLAGAATKGILFFA
jgi:hypothetical protein